MQANKHDNIHAVWTVERLRQSFSTLDVVGHLPVLNVRVRLGAARDQFPHKYAKRPLQQRPINKRKGTNEKVKTASCIGYIMQEPAAWVSVRQKLTMTTICRKSTEFRRILPL
jgi:hypothetical protein